MSIEQALGIEPLVAEADRWWPDWTAGDALLAGLGNTAAVEAWRDQASQPEREELFRRLGQIIRDPARRRFASAVMVQLLVPGAAAVVTRRGFTGVDRGEVEQVTAGYVWEQVLSYPWQSPPDAWIPKGLLRSVGRAVDREFGWGDRGEGAWRTRIPTDADVFEKMAGPGAPDDVEATELYWGELYSWASTQGIVTAADLDVLLQLAVVATDEQASYRSNAGITSRQACPRLATAEVPAHTVQYRARRSLSKLRQAAISR